MLHIQFGHPNRVIQNISLPRNHINANFEEAITYPRTIGCGAVNHHYLVPTMNIGDEKASGSIAELPFAVNLQEYVLERKAVYSKNLA